MRTATGLTGPAGRVAPSPGPSARRPALLLCVLAVLTGILAMHGLTSTPAPPPTAHTTHTVRADHSVRADHTVRADHAAMAADPGGCADEGPGDGHGRHADPTCAAAGTSGAPILAAPAAAPDTAPASAAPSWQAAPPATACGRAPPSLSELQLLRV
ncbi:DUF6153 family protein [Streptomyces sp. NPDC088097]|uniref:DUF6153 family protein n=1 Tax=Streptomyces sp. NPDC088097 TaxID=3365823 RepID=UPI00380D7251